MENSKIQTCMHCFRLIESTEKENEEVIICDPCKNEWRKDNPFLQDTEYKEDGLVFVFFLSDRPIFNKNEKF